MSRHAWTVAKATTVVVLAGAIAGLILVGIPVLGIYIFRLVTK